MILKSVNAGPTDKVLSVPDIETYKSDLKKAKIPYTDERGNRADFHSLRKTYGTLMQLQGVSARTAQELMRHSDQKLTLQVYTDANMLPKEAAIHSLPDITTAIPSAIYNMAKQGNTSLEQSQGENEQNPLMINDNGAKGMLSPAVSQEENGARGGSRTFYCDQCLQGFCDECPTYCPLPPEVRCIAQAWDTLSEPLREAVLAIVRTASGKEVSE